MRKTILKDTEFIMKKIYHKNSVLHIAKDINSNYIMYRIRDKNDTKLIAIDRIYI